jgi:hypothetical protein
VRQEQPSRRVGDRRSEADAWEDLEPAASSTDDEPVANGAPPSPDRSTSSATGAGLTTHSANGSLPRRPTPDVSSVPTTTNGALYSPAAATSMPAAPSDQASQDDTGLGAGVKSGVENRTPAENLTELRFQLERLFEAQRDSLAEARQIIEALLAPEDPAGSKRADHSTSAPDHSQNQNQRDR